MLGSDCVDERLRGTLKSWMKCLMSLLYCSSRPVIVLHEKNLYHHRKCYQVHDFRHADGTVANGVHDYSAVGCMPIRVAAIFNSTCVMLQPFGMGFTAVTRCLNPNGTLYLDWGGQQMILSRTNHTHGLTQCDKH